jgi:electron transfer flavoprotein alpha subunit
MEKFSNEVWVFVEQRSGKAADVSFELLSKGRKLAQILKGKLKAVVIGSDMRQIAQQTFRYGAEECLLVDHPDLKDYKTVPYSRILNELVSKYTPRVVLYGASFIGRDLAPRVASYTRSGLTADCTDLQISDLTYLRQDYKNLLLQIRPAFGGNIIATIITPDVPIQMATVREGVMENLPLETEVNGKVIEIPYTPNKIDQLIKIIEKHQEESKVNLKSAPIIVAHVLGGEIAGSRAAVDAGFITHERQVGQTGVTVRPKLYIACGISGAIQHRAGMQNSNKIIAINNDPEAPIFDICHYGIVGNVMDVIPNFIEVYKQKLK